MPSTLVSTIPLNKLLKSIAATALLITSTVTSATNIQFSDEVRNDTYARVLFQFDNDTGNVANNVSDKTMTQMGVAMEVYEFEGEHGAKAKLVAPPDENTKKIVVMGLGSAEELGRAEAVAMGGKIAQMFTHKDVQNVDVVLTNISGGVEDDVLAASIAHGISLGSYRFNNYRKDATAPNNDYRIIVESEKQTAAEYARLQAVEEGVFLARDLVNLNGADLTPVEFVETAQKELRGLGVDVTVFDDKKIKDMGMGLLYAVGQGSIPGSRLVIAHYKGSDDKPIALVGKGVTFDTGGYNIKTHKSIAWMKGDMAGAAAVLGAIKALAEQKAKVNVIAVMPLAQNMVSETALLPGDIIESMSGKTVEIVNTDAEGRMVMADAMWHIQEEYEPEIVLNIATLTGAKIRAVGDRYAGLFSDDMELIEQLTTSGETVNEHLWRLPLAYGDKLKSTLADSTNIGSGGPGATTAAMFLKQFVQDDTRWVHIDIAGSESADSTKNEVPEGGVGYGVRLLTEWLTSR